MNYEEALHEWGARILETARRGYGKKAATVIDRDTVKVWMEFDSGYQCCNGTDPDCYCSFAESPSASVEISGVDEKGKQHTTSISHYDFDFATILREIIEAGGGTVTAPNEEPKVIHARQCGYMGCGFDPCINIKKRKKGVVK